MRRTQVVGLRFLRFSVRLAGLTALLVVVPFIAAACGAYEGASTTLISTTQESFSATVSTLSSPTTAPPSVRPTIRDSGDTTMSTTPPASVPARGSEITPEQVLELVADRSQIAPADWELRAHETLGDWAVATLYTSKLSEQMDDRGVAAVFEKKGRAWFQAGWVSVSDSPHQQETELTNMGAPENVWRYFGLDPASLTSGGAAGRAYPLEQMPADFQFVADYGVAGRNRLDSFQGLFFKDLGPKEERASTKLVLSNDDLQSLYCDLAMIESQWHVFSTEFAPDPDSENTGTTMFVQPYATYRLTWSAGGFVARTLTWEDSALSQAPEAVALRAWFKKLQQAIEATPEWKALPPMKGGYA